MIAYVLIVIFLILMLAWIYIRYDAKTDHYEVVRSHKVKETIRWLYQSVNDICYQCNMSPIYNIHETTNITYTEKLTNNHNIKGIIYLVVWDEKNSRVFNPNTLMYAVLHELAHILSPSIHHEPPFDSIETILLNTATNLGYYDPEIDIESHYMTLDITYVS
jgi:hypothetical protein